MIGTYESDSDFDIVVTLNDQDGIVVDLKSGGDATVTASLKRGGATYLRNASVTLNADPDGNPPTLTIANAAAIKLPAGIFSIHFLAVLNDLSKRRWRDTIEIVR